MVLSIERISIKRSISNSNANSSPWSPISLFRSLAFSQSTFRAMNRLVFSFIIVISVGFITVSEIGFIKENFAGE